MKKTNVLIFLLVSLIAVFAIFMFTRHKVSFQDHGEAPSLAVRYDMGVKTVYPWYDEADDTWYYFLPSHIDETKIWCGGLKNTLCVNGSSQNGNFSFSSGEKYTVLYNGLQYNMAICPTTNVSTVFISTDSGTMDNIHEDKEIWESGEIVSLDNKGHVEYQGGLDRISGRGNVTWFQEKKPYHIRLSTVGQLGGLEGAQSWNLLALWFDGDKIHSKLAFDIAEILGAEHTPDAAWVNLYLNGEYRGLYLLTESLSAQDEFNREQDEFLLEKDFLDECQNETYFISEGGAPFVVVRPKNVSGAQLEAIRELVQNVEIAIESASYEQEIDLESFVSQFLIEEISLNYDAFVASAYLYKPANEQKLYAGPAWDYDGAFAEYLHYGVDWVNPAGTVVGARAEQLDWYFKLYQTQQFQAGLYDQFGAALPKLNELFDKRIDMYAEWLADSVMNDDIRWKWTSGTEFRAGSYQTWENDVRYLKYFCQNRVKVLHDRYGVEGEVTEWVPEEGSHLVRFEAYGSEVYQTTVHDGDTIDISSVAELKDYIDGIWVFSYSEEGFNECLPILEDCTIVWKPRA